MELQMSIVPARLFQHPILNVDNKYCEWLAYNRNNEWLDDTMQTYNHQRDIPRSN